MHLRLSSIKLLLLTLSLLANSICLACEATSHRLLNKMPNDAGVYIIINDFAEFVELLQAILNIDEEQLDAAWFAPSRLENIPNRKRARELDEASFEKLLELIDQFEEAELHGQALIVFDPSSKNGFGPVFMLELEESEKEQEVVELLGTLVEVAWLFEDGCEFVESIKGTTWNIVNGVLVASADPKSLERFSSIVEADIKPAEPLVETRLHRRAMASLETSNLAEPEATIFVTRELTVDFVRRMTRMTIRERLYNFNEIERAFFLDECLFLAASIRKTRSDAQETSGLALASLDGYLGLAQPGSGISRILSSERELELNAPFGDKPIYSYFNSSLDGKEMASYLQRVKDNSDRARDDDSSRARKFLPIVSDPWLELLPEATGYSDVVTLNGDSVELWTSVRINETEGASEKAALLLNSGSKLGGSIALEDAWHIAKSDNGIKRFELTEKGMQAAQAKVDEHMAGHRRLVTADAKLHAADGTLKDVGATTEAEYIEQRLPHFIRFYEALLTEQMIQVGQWLLLNTHSPAEIDQLERQYFEGIESPDAVRIRKLVKELEKSCNFKGNSGFVYAASSLCVLHEISNRIPRPNEDTWLFSESQLIKQGPNSKSYPLIATSHRVRSMLSGFLSRSNGLVVSGEMSGGNVLFRFGWKWSDSSFVLV